MSLILPGGEMYDEAIYARDILRRNGVDINSFANGAWLDQASHNGRYFKRYTIYVYQKIAAAEAAGGKGGVLQGLQQLRQELMSGQLDHLL